MGGHVSFSLGVILQLQLLIIVLQSWQAYSVCCPNKFFDFKPKPDVPCSDIKNSTRDDDKCVANVCIGSIGKYDCCGDRECNIFCCACKGRTCRFDLYKNVTAVKLKYDGIQEVIGLRMNMELKDFGKENKESRAIKTGKKCKGNKKFKGNWKNKFKNSLKKKNKNKNKNGNKQEKKRGKKKGNWQGKKKGNKQGQKPGQKLENKKGKKTGKKRITKLSMY